MGQRTMNPHGTGRTPEWYAIFGRTGCTECGTLYSVQPARHGTVRVAALLLLAG
jgi:hypothetical protein